MVLLLALSNGVHENLVKAATTIASGHVNVAGFYKTSPNVIGVPVVNEREEIKSILRTASPSIIRVIDRHRGWSKWSLNRALGGLYGVNIQQEQDLISRLRSVSSAHPADRLAAKGSQHNRNF